MALLIALDHFMTALAGLIVAGSLAMLPDIDMRLPGVKHRGISHTIWVPLGVVIIVAALSRTPFGLALVLAIGVFTGVDRIVPGLKRRGSVVTYTTSLLAGALAWSLLSTSTNTLPYFEIVIGAAAGLSVTAHLLADTITPMGLTPFWPVSDAEFSLGLVTADSWIGNTVLLVSGVAASYVAFSYASSLPL